MISSRRRPPRLAVMLLTLAAVAAACGGGGESANDTTTTTERARTTEPDDTSTTTTTAPDDEPPLENTGEDFQAIAQSIRQYTNWLFRHPDPALLENYMHPLCACFEAERAKLQLLRDNGWRARGEQGRITRVEVQDRNSADQATLQVVLEVVDPDVIDAAGAVVQGGEDVPPYRLLMSLLRSEGRWRVLDTQPLGPA